MRVLLLNRTDARSNPGGDTVQMEKTRDALQRLGAEVHVGDVDALDDLPRCDVAHVFNIQTVQESCAAFDALRRRGVPAVLSSIYWDMLEYDFARAAGGCARWRWVRSLMGGRRARRMYMAWQRLKAPGNAVWQAQRRLLLQAARVLPNSQSEADVLARVFKLGGAFRGKVDVVPNGIDPALFDPLPPPSRSFLDRFAVRDFVLQVGRIAPEKNQSGLLSALYDLPMHLVIVGQPSPSFPEYGERCREIAARRGNVTFVESVPHEDLPGIYSLAAVHALPSWRETPGLASLEAAAAGCRVVTTSIGSARDYFGDLAWYCHPGNLLSIRTAVERALAAPRPAALRERILTDFTWQHAGAATLASYRSALALR